MHKVYMQIRNKFIMNCFFCMGIEKKERKDNNNAFRSEICNSNKKQDKRHTVNKFKICMKMTNL